MMASEIPAGPIQDWEAVYRHTKPEDLPWNAGAPDSALIRLVESGRVVPGRALDIGTGPGHDAAYLAQEGFQVTAIDVAPTAIELARATAREAGVEARIEFRVEDILKLLLPEGSLSLVNDRGCFHVLKPEDRPAYVARIHAMLKPGGWLVLRTFCIDEPPGPGPYRFSRAELEDCFSTHLKIVKVEEGVFEGPRKPRAYLAWLQKGG